MDFINWRPQYRDGHINWGAQWSGEGQPPVPPPVAILSVAIFPPAQKIAYGTSAQLEARVYGVGAVNPDVTWSIVSGSGTITPQGLYTAGNADDTVVVRATAVGNQLKYAEATITVVEKVEDGLHPIIRYAARIGGRLVRARTERELQAYIEDFEAEAQERAERKAAAEARKSRPRTPRRLARTAPRIEDIEAPDAEQAAIQAMVDAANARIRETYEAAAQAQLVEQRLADEMARREQQFAEDMEAMIALEGTF